MANHNTLRPDLKHIADQIKPGSRVLDLGCADGELLAWLQANKTVRGIGVDVDVMSIVSCVDGEPLENASRFLLQGMAESRESLPALALRCRVRPRASARLRKKCGTISVASSPTRSRLNSQSNTNQGRPERSMVQLASTSSIGSTKP